VRVTNEIGQDFRHNLQIGPLVTTQDGYGLSNARARLLRCEKLRDLVVSHWDDVKGRDRNDRPEAHVRRKSRRSPVGSHRPGRVEIDPSRVATRKRDGVGRRKRSDTEGRRNGDPTEAALSKPREARHRHGARFVSVTPLLRGEPLPPPTPLT
jgi:hypothetical protein